MQVTILFVKLLTWHFDDMTRDDVAREDLTRGEVACDDMAFHDMVFKNNIKISLIIFVTILL